MAIDLTEHQIVDILIGCAEDVQPINSEFKMRMLLGIDFNRAALKIIIASKCQHTLGGNISGVFRCGKCGVKMFNNEK